MNVKDADITYTKTFDTLTTTEDMYSLNEDARTVSPKID